MSIIRRSRPGLSSSTRGRRLRVAGAVLAGLIVLLLPAQSALAEGSYDLNIGPGTALRNRLAVNAGSNGPDHTGYTVLRAYARAGETIDMGSSAMGLGGSADILVYAPGTSFASATEAGRRATQPSDSVFGSYIFSCSASAPATGRIAGRAAEEAGPLPNAGGYTPCQYVAPADGIYAIIMRPYAESGTAGVSTINSPDTSTGQATAISIWDVTVRDGEVEQSGRVFTNDFQFIIPTAAAAASNLSTFVYTPAGYIYHATIFNPRSKVWDLAANGSGVVDATTGEPISASFRWGPTGGAYPPTLEPTYGQALAPQMWEGDTADDSRYPLFYSEPDPAVIDGPGGLAETRGYSTTPMAPEGGLTSLLSFAGEGGEAGAVVQGAGGTIAIDAPQLQGADYGVTLDLDRDGTFGGGGDVELAGTLGAGATTATWDGRDSTGTVVPCGLSYDYQATSTLPAMHLIQSDTNSEAGTKIERLSLPADLLLGEPLAASYNDIDPYKASAVTNAAPSAVSEGTSGPTFHAWSSNSGHAVFTDTWASSHLVDGTGTFEVRCPAASPSTPDAGPTTIPDSPNPPSTSGASSPTGSSSAPKQHKHHQHHAHHAQPKAPRLALTLTADSDRARPSSVIGYRITVSNPGGSAARDIKVCDEPPAGQRVLRTFPTAAGKAEPCWTIPVLDAGARRVFRLTAMVDPLSGSEVQRNEATADASNVKGVREDRVAVRIAPLSETACASRLARPVASSAVPFRC